MQMAKTTPTLKNCVFTKDYPGSTWPTYKTKKTYMYGGKKIRIVDPMHAGLAQGKFSTFSPSVSVCPIMRA